MLLGKADEMECAVSGCKFLYRVQDKGICASA